MRPTGGGTNASIALPPQIRPCSNRMYIATVPVYKYPPTGDTCRSLQTLERRRQVTAVAVTRMNSGTRLHTRSGAGRRRRRWIVLFFPGEP